MSIRMKAFIYIVFFFVIMAVLVLAVQRSIIFPSFIKIEYNETAENILRVTKSIDREIFHLDKLCHDWAAWNDTYDFIESRSGEYIVNNLLDEAFSSNNVNLMFFFKNDGSISWGRVYDLETEEPVVVDFLDVDKLDPSHILISLSSSNGEEADKEKSGIIDTSQGPMIFVSRPILRSDGSGPSRGVLT
ncbi:MAG: CHASE4 domain-containing protein, partial [Desulfatiglandales bacterium]